MNLKQLTPSLSVSGQVDPAGLGLLASRGFHGIINNRPDGEGEGQPTSAQLEAAARSLGLDYRYIPVEPGQLTEEKVGAFRAALDEMRGSVLAFCRTGTRSASLWALSQAHHLDAGTIVRTAAQAGYDLAGLAPRLSAAHAGPTRHPTSSVATGPAAR